MTTTRPIPSEYLGFDYGFSGEDAPTEPQPVVVQQPVVDDDLRSKLDTVLALLESGQAVSTNPELEAKLREDIRKLEAIIIPLLNNLLKTADKEYIFWPNRKPIIEQQIQRVLEITRV